MKVPEGLNEMLKLAGGVSACAGGVIAIISAVAGAIMSTTSRSSIAELIGDEIMEKHSGLNEKALKSVVRSELKSNEYYNTLDFAQKGAVTEMVMKKLQMEIHRREALVC